MREMFKQQHQHWLDKHTPVWSTLREKKDFCLNTFGVSTLIFKFKTAMMPSFSCEEVAAVDLVCNRKQTLSVASRFGALSS